MSRLSVFATASAAGLLLVLLIIVFLVQNKATTEDTATKVPTNIRDQVQLSQHDTHDDGFLGVVLADELEHVVCPFDAFIERLLIREGNGVSLGQPLIQLKATHLDEDLDIARAALVAARVNAEEARLNRTQAQEKLERMDKAPSVYSQVDHREAELELARVNQRLLSEQSALKQAHIRLTALEERMGKSVIEAPFSGTIRSLRIMQGQQVSEGQDLLTLIAPSQGVIRFAVPPDKVIGVQNGTPVRMQIEGTDLDYTGTVTSINQQRDESSQLIFCLAQLLVEPNSTPPAGGSGNVFIAEQLRVEP